MVETLIGWAIGIILVPVVIFLAAVGVDAWENRGRKRSLEDLGESLDRAKDAALKEFQAQQDERVERLRRQARALGEIREGSGSR
ncbi:MAG: hypothetical protein F4X98_10520 [Gammaproteobacteria bacterium]|nr:hypothetical protein [Gammaproteobacteria bacterium]